MRVQITPLVDASSSPEWPVARRAYVAAYGFEDRTLAWLSVRSVDPSLSRVVFVRYVHPKGDNKIDEARALAKNKYPRASISEIPYTSGKEQLLEKRISDIIAIDFKDVEEILLDISAQSKLLILLWVVVAAQSRKRIRIIYGEADAYPPSQAQFEKVRATHGAQRWLAIAGFPSYGATSIVRTRSLSSIRMQGQPTTLIAFTSFNEELVRHVMSSINPHRLVLINGLPPRAELLWRAHATQELHSRLIEEYPADNGINDETGLLKRTVSTLDPSDTDRCLENIYESFGRLERIIAVGTGSKMQTVGLAVFRVHHPDVHVEYVTPDSYYFPGTPKGIRTVHSLEITPSEDDVG